METKVINFHNSFTELARALKVFSEFECDIDATSKHKTVDAKSIVGMMMLDLSEPITFTLHSDNPFIKQSFKEKLATF